MQSLSAFLLLFWWQKKSFKSPFDLHFHPFIIEFFWFAKLQFKIKEKIQTKAVMLLMCLEVLVEGFFWERLVRVCKKLLSLVKLYQRFWIWNIDQNLNDFKNRSCLHCTILKALQSFQRKRAHKSRDMQIFLQNVQNETFKIFTMFKKNMKFTRVVWWINSKIRNRSKTSHS